MDPSILSLLAVRACVCQTLLLNISRNLMEMRVEIGVAPSELGLDSKDNK